MAPLCCGVFGAGITWGVCLRTFSAFAKTARVRIALSVMITRRPRTRKNRSHSNVGLLNAHLSPILITTVTSRALLVREPCYRLFLVRGCDGSTQPNGIILRGRSLHRTGIRSARHTTHSFIFRHSLFSCVPSVVAGGRQLALSWKCTSAVVLPCFSLFKVVTILIFHLSPT